MWSATYWKEKSCRASAASSTAAATAVAPKAAISAFCADSARRLRPRQAANEPAASAYASSRNDVTIAARPRSGIYFLGAYFDGHFVTSVFGTATNTPLRSFPSTTTSRPVLNRSGTEPV